MNIEIIKNRIRSYSPLSLQEEENAIKEIYQEIALAGLARYGFFKIAGFQGGTCLRIVYKLNRFSEDLDFILLQPDKAFKWNHFLKGLEEEFSIYGIKIKIRSPGKDDKNIKKAVLKDDSFLKIFELQYERNKSHKQKIFLKFEVDINPPAASVFETHYLEFPLPFSIGAQNKPSLFASKCHALLCRSFLKGRDWYDFLWYVMNQVTINFEHLKNALIQTNHWKWEFEEPMTKKMLIGLLKEKVAKINWREAAEDVKAFLKPIDRDILKGWSKELFLSYVDKLNNYLKGLLQRAIIFRIADGPSPIMDKRLFSGAITEFDDDELEKINDSGTFFCQTFNDLNSLEDSKNYKVVFIHLDHPGCQKAMAGSTKYGKKEIRTYNPGQIYELPGWFIKDWNGRKLIHLHNIYRALYWFQPLDMIPKKIINTIKEYAKKRR